MIVRRVLPALLALVLLAPSAAALPPTLQPITELPTPQAVVAETVADVEGAGEGAALVAAEAQAEAEAEVAAAPETLFAGASDAMTQLGAQTNATGVAAQAALDQAADAAALLEGEVDGLSNEVRANAQAFLADPHASAEAFLEERTADLDAFQDQFVADLEFAVSFALERVAIYFGILFGFGQE